MGDWEEAYRRFAGYARKRGHRDPEDFASWAVDRLFRGLSRAQSLHYMWADYLDSLRPERRADEVDWADLAEYLEPGELGWELPQWAEKIPWFKTRLGLVFLAYAAGRTRADIACDLGMSVVWIGQMLHRARAQAEQLLEDPMRMPDGVPEDERWLWR